MTTTEPGPEQVMRRVQALPTNRRRGSGAPGHKRAQKTRPGNAAAWCVTGQRTKRMTTRAPTCSILGRGGASRQRMGDRPHRQRDRRRDALKRGNDGSVVSHGSEGYGVAGHRGDTHILGTLTQESRADVGSRAGSRVRSVRTF
jgi:hypothetical protein